MKHFETALSAKQLRWTFWPQYEEIGGSKILPDKGFAPQERLNHEKSLE